MRDRPLPQRRVPARQAFGFTGVIESFTVVAVGEDPPLVQVKIHGDATAVPARYDAGYAPTNGDTVYGLWLTPRGPVVLGKLA